MFFASILPSKHTYSPPRGESVVIGVNVFKFSLQLSGSFILPVVTANGCITTGSGLDPRGFSKVGGGGVTCSDLGQVRPPRQP